MIFENRAELVQRIEECSGRRVLGVPTVFDDTSAYMNIYGGCVLRLGGNDYYVLGDAHEGRFGIDDQAKYWVKYGIDLSTGATKIIKLVFNEAFDVRLGGVTVHCRRRPDKESAILRLMQGHPRFMQGETVLDAVGNQVRIIDYIPGKSLYLAISDLEVDHETYYYSYLPTFMRQVIICVEALGELHARGQHHGDIRNDHLIIRRDDSEFVWIDFDYWVNFADYDIWCLGNVLTFVVGKGEHRFWDIEHWPEAYPALREFPSEADAILLLGWRIANLRKLFPYISKDVNRILMRFSAQSRALYERLDDLIADLKLAFPASPKS